MNLYGKFGWPQITLEVNLTKPNYYNIIYMYTTSDVNVI